MKTITVKPPPPPPLLRTPFTEDYISAIETWQGILRLRKYNISDPGLETAEIWPEGAGDERVEVKARVTADKL